MNRIKEIFARFADGFGRAVGSNNPILGIVNALFLFCICAIALIAIVLLTVATYGVALIGFIVGMAYYYYQIGGKK